MTGNARRIAITDRGHDWPRSPVRRGNTMSVKEAYPRLVDALGDVRRQWRLHKLLEGTLLLAAGVGLVLTLLIVADNFWQPGKAGRVLPAALLWGRPAAAILSLGVRR